MKSSKVNYKLQLQSSFCFKADKLDSMENQFSHLVEERKSVDVESQGLRNQLAKAQEKVRRRTSRRN